MSEWTIEMRVHITVETDSVEELRDMERSLAERVSDVDPHPGFVTAASWLFRARTAPQEPFQEAPQIGPGETVYVRRNGSRLRGRGPSY